MMARRRFVARLAALAALGLPSMLPAQAAPRVVRTGALDMAYHSAGPDDGHPVVLVHDFGYDTDSFGAVVPLLAAAGLRVLLPLQRGHGATRFADPDAPRSAEPAALGKDLIDFIDALHLPEAVFAGVGWGAHAAWAAAVVRPTRCIGLVLAGLPRIDAAGPFERYLFQSQLGGRELRRDPRGAARALWRRDALGVADTARFQRAMPGFDNPDFAAILTHAWAFRHAGAPADPAYAALARKFMPAPVLATAAIALPDTGPATLHDAPRPLADAAIALSRTGQWRT